MIRGQNMANMPPEPNTAELNPLRRPRATEGTEE